MLWGKISSRNTMFELAIAILIDLLVSRGILTGIANGLSLANSCDVSFREDCGDGDSYKHSLFVDRILLVCWMGITSANFIIRVRTLFVFLNLRVFSRNMFFYYFLNVLLIIITFHRKYYIMGSSKLSFLTRVLLRNLYRMNMVNNIFPISSPMEL